MPAVDTLVSSKPGLVTDLNPSYIQKDQYSHARNAVRNSKDGDLGTISNEPSTIACITVPYKVLGHIKLPDDTFLIFSGDGKSSEIGIGNPQTCAYSTLKNLDCLAFDERYPLQGEAKKDFNKGIVVTFIDKNSNMRRIELNKLKDVQDCDDILLFKKITHPCITVSKGQIGNIPNGTYSVAIGYAVDGQLFTDLYAITNRVQLFSETGANSLEIKIEDLDDDFEEYIVVVVGSFIDPITKGVTKLAKVVGSYSTKIRTLSVTDFLNPTYKDVPISTLVARKQTWQKAGIIASNSNYLILADLVGRPEENYQLKAMSIEAEYVVEQVLADYYSQDGEDVGYYRDENYEYFIQGVYNTGELTDKFYIPGKEATAFDRAIVSSPDVYEYDTQFSDCIDHGKVERWQAENTAGEMIPYNNKFVCDRRVLGRGEMGYWESTEPLPDNKDMFGDKANTPRTLHKMPDESKVPRYQYIDGKAYINILGVRFKNIPKFDSPDIVGYKITRSDRKGGNGTVVARGIMTNVRSYYDEQLDQTILYSNYGVNDLSPDQFLSKTQTAYKNGSEHNFNPLTDYSRDKFNFYSPHTLFEPRYSLGTELKIEAEEIAEVKGSFDLVYKHPKQRLLNQFSFWIAAAVGFIEASLVILGKNTHSQEASWWKSGLGVASGVNFTNTSGRTFNITTVADLIALDIPAFIASKVLAGDATAISDIKRIVVIIESLALKIPYSIFSGIIEADKIIDTIDKFTGYTDYVYQYNAYAKFNKSIPVKEGNKRRRLKRAAVYLPSDVVTIDNAIFNNYFGEKSVYLELNKEIADPTVKDTTRNTMTGFQACDTRKTQSTGSAFYVTSKVVNPNQYGRLGSATPVSMHSCVLEFGQDSPILYGGDCVIERMSFQKRKQFFNQNLTNTNYPDGTEYDYRLYRNIGYPRFWMDTTKYDFSQLISSNVINFTRFSRTTSSKYNLDCKKSKDGKSISRIDDAYMYLGHNTALEFFVEADYNVAYREKTEQPFFSKNNMNLQDIFRSDRLAFPEEFKISMAYADIYTTEIFAQQQREDFDPANPIPVSQPNSVIYSLPSYNLQKADNWQYFLPANYFSFREADFGQLTGIHKIDQDRLIFLFSKSSPYLSMGRDILELEGSGRKITIGDGGLFAQDPRESMPTDNNYGACNSPYAFVNSHLGRYYPSERQGRIIEASGMTDITREGISYWCKNYMPIILYSYFPEYPQIENPLGGVGYLMAFDSFNETVYISKRDFSPKKEYVADITYDKSLKQFFYKDIPIVLRSGYFNDISWTLSYSPSDKGFISWHDWHPDWVIQTDNHFMTVKNNVIYKHNEAFDSFCNFYGKEYPYEIEFVSSSGQQVEMVRSLEYILEAYKYKNFGRDRFHVLNENFDWLIVSNSEQISPPLHMVHSNPNPEENLSYPRKSSTVATAYDIAFFKEENKYRVNQFWDAVKDRGEFSSKEIHLFPTDESGYRSIVNPVAIDLDKPESERKKFRHYYTKFRLIKSKSGPLKIITKLLNVKKNISIR